ERVQIARLVLRDLRDDLADGLLRVVLIEGRLLDLAEVAEVGQRRDQMRLGTPVDLRVGAQHPGEEAGPGAGGPEPEDEPVLHAAYLPASPTGVQRSAGGWLCREHLEAQPSAVRTHAVVAAEQAEIRERLAQQEGARQVQRIEGPHGLDGKRSLRALRDVAGHLEHGPSGRCACECLEERRAAHPVEPALGGGSSDHPPCLDEGQPGTDDLSCVAQQAMDLVGMRFVEQPAKDRAAFRIDRQHSARPASSSAWLEARSRDPGRAYAAASCGRPMVSTPAATRRPKACSAGLWRPSTFGRRSSATTRPRSVTRTTSPAATSRRYALNRFLSSLTAPASTPPM